LFSKIIIKILAIDFKAEEEKIDIRVGAK